MLLYSLDDRLGSNVSSWCRAIGAIAVTLPSCWYLWPSPKAEGHGHGHGHGEGHGEEGGSEHSGEGEEGEDAQGHGASSDVYGANTPPPKAREAQKIPSSGSQDDEADSSDSTPSDTPESSDSEGDSDNSMKNTPEASGPDDTERITESGNDVEGVQFKGATKDGAVGDTRKHIPDSKGGAKKRIESDYGNKLGEMSGEEQEADNDDKV